MSGGSCAAGSPRELTISCEQYSKIAARHLRCCVLMSYTALAFFKVSQEHKTKCFSNITRNPGGEEKKERKKKKLVFGVYFQVCAQLI